MAWFLRRLLGAKNVVSDRSAEISGLSVELAAKHLRRNPEVIAQRAENETILFCMSSGQYYSLNEVGARIWEMFDGTRTAAAIIEQLEDEYDAAQATISEDVLFLTSELSGNGLLVDGGGGNSEG